VNTCSSVSKRLLYEHTQGNGRLTTDSIRNKNIKEAQIENEKRKELNGKKEKIKKGKRFHGDLEPSKALTI